MQLRVGWLISMMLTATACLNRESVDPAAQATLVVAPTALPADGASSATITLSGVNNDGRPLGNDVVVSFQTTNANVFIFQPASRDANGTYVGTLRCNAPGVQNVTVTLTRGGATIPLGVTTALTCYAVVPAAGPPSPNFTTFTANPNLLAADNTSAATLMFTVRDANDMPVSGAAVTFSSTGSSNRLTPASGLTDSTGVLTATLTSTRAETKTVAATVGSLSLSATVVFLPGPPSATTSTLSANPATVTADGVNTTLFTLTLKDAFGNVTPGQAVTFFSSGANNAWTRTTGTTDGAGVLTTALASTTAEAKTVTASFAGGNVTTVVTFVGGTPASSTTTVAVSPSGVVADGTSTTTLTVTVRDAFGNPVAGQAVSVSASGSNNVITPASGSSDAAGVFTATLASTTAESKTITALAGSANASTSVTFIAGPPSASTTLSASPTFVVADGTSLSTLTLTVYDAHGNPVPGQAVSLVSTGSNNTLSPTSGTTDSSGTFTATLASTTAEIKAVTATAGSISKTTNITFTPGAPAAATTTFAANPTSLTADGTSTSTLTVTAYDAHGNAIPNQAVSLTSSGSNNSFGQSSGSTNSAGIFSTTLASTTAEAKTVTASLGPVNKTTSVTFNAGLPSSTTTTVSVNPISVTADGSSTTQLTVLVKDRYGNSVAGQTVTLASTGSSNTLSPTSGTTDATGTLTATLASTKAETKTLTATAGPATASTNVTFVPGAASSTTTVLVANPNTVAADGVSVTTLVTTALDAQGNPVPGQTVTLSSSGSTNTFSSTSGTTNAAGTFTATLSSSTPELKTITSQVAGSITKNATVQFTTAVVNQANSTLVASPNALIADGSATTTLTVTVRDGNNTPLIGQTVTMSATGSANTFSPVSGATDASGIFTTTLKSTQSGAKTITATVDAATLNTTVTFNAGAPAGSTTTLTASPNTVTADGTSASTLTVLVQDINGNPVPAQAVSLASTGGNNTLSPTSGNTDATGTFTATLASTLAETKTVTATIGSINKTATVKFVPGSVNGTKTTLTASPNTVTADGVSVSTLTATVKDGQGNPIANQIVSLASTGSNNAFTPASGTTNASGVFTATLASTTAQLKVITATIGAVNENANVTFAPGAPATGTTTLTANPTSLTADGVSTTTLTATVEDAHGNLISGQAVSFSVSGASNTFGAATGSTNSNGVFTTTLASTLAQNENITVSAGSASAVAAVTFVAGSPNSAISSLIASPTSLVANGTASTTLTVTVKDAHGNPVANQPVSLSSSGTANTLAPVAGSTNAAGIFTATLASTKAEIKVATASVASFNETASITFTAGAPSGTNTTVVASPTTVTADGTSTTTLTVTVEDAQGNPVNNQAVSLGSSGSNNTFSPAAGNTNASGIFTATLASTKAEAKTVTATIGALGPTAAVTFVPGAPSSATSSVSVSPGMVTADGTSTTTVTVTVKDASGNLITGQGVSVTASGIGNAWGATSGTTAAGVWTTTLACTKAQTETITATVGVFNETTSMTFVVGAASSGTSSLTASPNAVADDGVATTTLLVTVEDATSNPINGQAVTFSSTGTSYTFSATTCSTNAAGQCSVTLKSTVAQTVTVTASFAAVSKNATVQFNVGAANSAQSSLTLTPTTLVANGVTTTALTVTVKDATGNLISGQAVTFSGSGTNNTFTPTTGTTNASGVLTATLKTTTAQSETITASMGSATANASVTFTAGAASAAKSTLVASPNSLTADGTSTTTLTVTVEDVNGNVVSGQAVTFSSTGTSNTFSATTGTTNASGVFTATLKTTKAQIDPVQAAFAGINLNANVTFVAGAPSATTTTLSASPTSLTANGTSASTLTFTVEDVYANPVAGQAVTFSSTGTNNTFSAPTGTTNASGVFTATLKSTKAQVDTVSAGAATVSKTAMVTFIAGSPSSSTSYISASPSSLAAGSTTTVTVTVEDAQGNPINGQSVTALHSPGVGITLGATAGGTGGAGTWSTSLVSTYAGVKLLYASVGGFTVTGAVTFTATTPFCANAVMWPNAPRLSTGTTPVAVVTQDFNNDAHVDAVIVNAGAGTLLYAPGKGNGLFGTGSTISNSTAQGTFSIVTGDLNQDGKPDLATSIPDSNSTITLLLGQNNGTFVSTGSSPIVSSTPITLALGTLNSDAYPDLATTEQSLNEVGVLLNTANGTGNMGAVTSYGSGGAAPVAVAVGKMNADATMDIVSASNSGSSVSVLLGRLAGGYNAAVTYPVGSAPTGLALADFNADGNTDVVTSNWSAHSVSVLLNKGNGILQAATSYPLNAGSLYSLGNSNSTQIVQAVDLNNDGALDILTTGYDSGMASVLLNKGNGTFNAAQAYFVGSAPLAIAAADFNGDGNQDFIVAASKDNQATVMLNAGGGTFNAPISNPAGSNENASNIADFNNDGIVDVLITNVATQTLSISFGNNDGTFGSPTFYPVGVDPTMAVVADFNKDGNQDVAVINHNSNDIYVFPGKGSGLLGTSTVYSLGGKPWSLRGADLNADGYIDLLASNFPTNAVDVLIGRGDGTFNAMVAYTGGSGVNDIAVADFNGDGNVDVATADYGGMTVSILLGNGTGALGPATSIAAGGSKLMGIDVADFDGDGNVDVVVACQASNLVGVLLGKGDGTLQPVVTYATGNGPNYVTVADINGDAIPDIATANVFTEDITVLLCNGNGTFQAAANYIAGPQPSSVAVKDVNGDGKADFVSANYFSSSTFSVGLSKGCLP